MPFLIANILKWEHTINRTRYSGARIFATWKINYLRKTASSILNLLPTIEAFKPSWKNSSASCR